MCTVCPMLPKGKAISDSETLNHLVLCASRKARAGGDEATNDDIFFESHEPVFASPDRRIDEHARRILERCRRKKTLACERDFGDAQDELVRFRRFLSFRFQVLVCLLKMPLFDDVYDRVLAVSRTSYFVEREHL